MEDFTIICNKCGDSNETDVELNVHTLRIAVVCNNCDHEEEL